MCCLLLGEMRLFLRVALHFITNVHKIMDLNRWPFTIVTSVVDVVIVVVGRNAKKKPFHQIIRHIIAAINEHMEEYLYIYMVAISDHIVPK